MNEIISKLERQLEQAEIVAARIRCNPIATPELDYRAVLEMAVDHLRDTLYLFRHARKLKNELDALRKSEKDGREDTPV